MGRAGGAERLGGEWEWTWDRERPGREIHPRQAPFSIEREKGEIVGSRRNRFPLSERPLFPYLSRAPAP